MKNLNLLGENKELKTLDRSNYPKEPTELEYYESLLQEVEETLEDEGPSGFLMLQKLGILLKIEEINNRV